MISVLRSWLAATARFVQTPALGRSVVGLLSLAIVLLLIVNVAVFVMVQRMTDATDAVEEAHKVRLLSQEMLTRLVDAETGQRGFLLTGRAEYLRIHDEAVLALEPIEAELERRTRGDPEVGERLARVRALTTARLDMMARTIQLARSGRTQDAVEMIRGGRGKAMMDAAREEIAAIDVIAAERIETRNRLSERGATVTLVVNVIAGLLILVLAGISVWLVRRYVAEISAAREALDRLNAGLETQVEGRTAELTRANDEIQRYAYIVSHDLRSPLVNIMGYTAELEQAGIIIDRQLSRLETLVPDLIESDAVTAVRDDMPEAIGFIRASTAKMDRLINAILRMSREGRRNLIPETLDVTAMVQSIADTVRHQTEAADAQIVVEPLPPIESDRISMEQILGNLIDNAVKYLVTGRPGRILVSGEEIAGGWIVYRVVDNGRGVAERDHERIFELFRRAGKQDRVGEGLGLAFVRNSVRRLGGDIGVESELGKGSTFLLKFPTRLILVEAGDSA